MALIRWNPGVDLAAMEIDSLHRMFDAAFNGEPMTRGGWVPPADIYETADKDIVVKVELPEMKREDIKITFENDVLLIEGQRHLATDVDRGQYHRVERGYGQFRRSFTLPATVDGTRVTANFQDGVLAIRLPRRAETRPRQIAINE